CQPVPSGEEPAGGLANAAEFCPIGLVEPRRTSGARWRTRSAGASWLNERGGIRMTLRQSLILILVVTVVCGAVGLGLGYSLGTLAPDFYRGTFAPPRRALRGEVPREEFNPAALGRAL